MFQKIYPFLKGILLTKGGPGSGNFGHSGRPGERGGSSSDGGTATAERPKGEKARKLPTVTYNGKKFDQKAVENEMNTRTRADRGYDPEYLKALAERHGLSVTYDKNVGKDAILATEEALAQQPDGTLQHMQDKGVKVSIRASDSPERRSITVDGKTFVAGGSADYKTGELLSYDQGSYEGNHLIVSHEAGHFGMELVAGTVAEGESIRKIAASAKRNMEGLPEDNANYQRWNEEYKTNTELYERDYAPLSKALDDFERATKTEGAVTPYSSSFANSTMMDRFYDDGEHSRGNGNFGVSRHANENFAETNQMIYSGTVKRGYGEKQLRSSKPKTYSARRTLIRFLSKPQKRISTKWVQA
jgi:hypothetical protein